MPSWGALHKFDAVSSGLIRSRLSNPRIPLQLLYPPWRNRALHYSDQRHNWPRFEFLDRLEQEQRKSPTLDEGSLNKQSQDNGQWPINSPNDQEPLSITTNARHGSLGSPEERAHIDESFKNVHTGSHKNEAILSSLLQKLDRAAVKVPNAKATNKLLRKIILDEHVRPEVSHYEALVLSNCDPKNGSVDMIEAVLQEMEEQEIEVGSAIYTACLKVRSLVITSSSHSLLSGARGSSGLPCPHRNNWQITLTVACQHAYSGPFARGRLR